MTISSPNNTYLIPVRGLNEFTYCPRLFHLMYVQGLFEESIDTLKGKIAHEKRIGRGKAVSSQSDHVKKSEPWRAETTKEFSLSSETLSIIGKFDVLVSEIDELVPVEIKSGSAPEGSGIFSIGPYQLAANAWGNDQLQLAAQMALLQEAGHNCFKGRLYYRQTKTLIEIPWNENLLSVLRWVIDQIKTLISKPMPPPLVDSKKCLRCSLNHVCLPDETLLLQGTNQEPRQLYPGRDDCGVLHLITPGTCLGKSGEAVKMTVPEEDPILIPVKDIAHVCCWGNVQVTTQLALELASRGIGISWLTSGGWLRATTTAPLEKNVLLRRSQYRICDDAASCLQLSRWIVAAKIENQRVLLRRNQKDNPEKDSTKTLQACREEAAHATNIETLRGIEGYAAKTYWEAFPALLQEKDGVRFQMDGRNRRPPQDPINALLSFGYAMLLRDFMTALHGVGIDPLYGFYHALVPGRPALALDLMEAFRPLIVDSTVLRTINEGSFTKEDFVQMEGCCVLRPTSKKRWIKAYERRVDENTTHTITKTSLNYRRIFTVEARLLGRFFSGELQEYHPLTTR